MKIKGIRIDNRLLHGIVATQWIPMAKCNRIIVIDDKVANDFILKEMMKLARPANIAISILDTETVIDNLQSGRYEKQKIFIITRDTKNLIKLYEIGLLPKEINIGITAKNKEDINIAPGIYISNDELEDYKYLISRGYLFDIRIVPSDKKIMLNNLLETLSR